jgi:hypothetical protein
MRGARAIISVFLFLAWGDGLQGADFDCGVVFDGAVSWDFKTHGEAHRALWQTANSGQFRRDMDHGGNPAGIRALRNNEMKGPPRRFSEDEIFENWFQSWLPEWTPGAHCLFCESHPWRARAKILAMKQGDSITTADGTTITLGEYVGSGDLTILFRAQEFKGWLVRLPYAAHEPLRLNPVTDTRTAQVLYHKFWEGLDDAKDLGLSVVEYRRVGKLVLVKELEDFETLYDFAIRYGDSVQTIPEPERQLKLAGAARQILAMKGRRGVRDIFPTNIGWSGADRNWLIFDAVRSTSGVGGVQGMYHEDYSALIDSLRNLSNDQKFWRDLEEIVGSIEIFRAPRFR